MSVSGPRDFPELRGGGQALPKIRDRQPRRGRLFGIRTGQLVATQVAAVALILGAVGGLITLAAAAPLALAILALTWLRMRRRWAFEWLAIAMRFSGRRRAASVETSDTALLDFVSPGARIVPADLAGDPAAVIVDATGMTAVLELGDPTGLLAEGLPMLPSPASLLPPAGGEHPPVRIQLVLTGVPSPGLWAGGGMPANSYRQLTDGRLLGHSRALLAIRVLFADGFPETDLLSALSGLVRKLPKKLPGIPARPLGEAAALRVIAELAHDTGFGTAQEGWPALRIGDLPQTTFRLHRWPDLRIETSRRIISRMLALPAAATTVAVTAGPRAALSGEPRVEMTVRLAAPDTAGLSLATQALRKMLADEQAHVQRLDGEQLDGLTATLPLGGGPLRDLPGRPGENLLVADRIEGLELPVAVSGLMIGSNRQGDPVVARLFRPEQTRALLIGGVPCAQLIALRAMALGARVVIQSTRPQLWSPFLRGSAVPGELIALLPPGRVVDIPPGSALHPLLVIVDVGPVAADSRTGAGFQATLVVRDDFTAADVDVATRADLLLLQPLRADEAELVGAAVGLGETAQWLTRIRPDMVAVVNRRAVRWAALAQTPLEAHLIGPPVRS